MSVKLLVTTGFGNGTFNGTIKDVVTMGYTIGIQITKIGYILTAAEIDYARNIEVLML